LVSHPAVGVGAQGPLGATPHKARLTAWRHIYLHLFRHIARKFLAGRQPSGVVTSALLMWYNSDEKSDCVSAPPALCGIALEIYPRSGYRNFSFLIFAIVCSL
jgi:hypothetical protein